MALAMLILASAIDVGLATLLVAVSGFILEGVNSTGPMMPEAILLVAFIVFCLVAPIAAFVMRARGAGTAPVLIVAAAPIAIAILVMAAEPLFA